jgi:glycerol-3-phosphate acyltransferase PlsY
MSSFLFILDGYKIGSFPTAYIAARLSKGIDNGIPKSGK